MPHFWRKRLLKTSNFIPGRMKFEQVSLFHHPGVSVDAVPRKINTPRGLQFTFSEPPFRGSSDVTAFANVFSHSRFCFTKIVRSRVILEGKTHLVCVNPQRRNRSTERRGSKSHSEIAGPNTAFATTSLVARWSESEWPWAKLSYASFDSLPPYAPCALSRSLPLFRISLSIAVN